MNYILSNEEEKVLHMALGKELISISKFNSWTDICDESAILSFVGGLNIVIHVEPFDLQDEDSRHRLTIFTVNDIYQYAEQQKLFIDSVRTKKIESIEIITDTFKYPRSSYDFKLDDGIIFRDSDNIAYSFFIDGDDYSILLDRNKPINHSLAKSRLIELYTETDEHETEFIPEITRTSRYFEYDNQLEKILNPLDSMEYLVDGGQAYVKKDFKKAFANYNLAAAMGNMDAVSNLGYCYMYGNGVEKNFELAQEYFKLAAKNDNIDALYKLGTFYASDEYGMQDFLISDRLFERAYDLAKNKDDLSSYPSLLLAIAKEKMPGGRKMENLGEALELLAKAHESFSFQIFKGADFYNKHLEEVDALINNKCFDSLDKKYVKQILISHNVINQELESEPYREISLSKIDNLVSLHDSSLLRVTYDSEQKILTLIVDQSYESFSNERLWEYYPEYGPIQFKFKNVKEYNGPEFTKCYFDVLGGEYSNKTYALSYYDSKNNRCEIIDIPASTVEITLKKKKQY